MAPSGSNFTSFFVISNNLLSFSIYIFLLLLYKFERTLFTKAQYKISKF